MTSDKGQAYITVKGFRVGIVGLREAIEKLSVLADHSDEEIASALCEMLKARNYIPPSVEGDYKKAFLLQFKKIMGGSTPDEEVGNLQICVLGPGCSICDQLEQMVLTILTEENIRAEVEHVRDPIEIAQYGIMSTPALIINGKVKSTGWLPSREQILKWIRG